MTTSYKRGWMRPVSLTLLSLAALTAACGGSDDAVGGATPPLSDADAAFCNGTDYQQVLHPVAGAAVGDGGEAVVQDLRTLRVHYRRTDGVYAGWGLHLWDTNGIDTSRLPFPASTLAQWGAPVPLSSMPGYTETATEVSFEVPVLNPAADASRKEFKFVIHGLGGTGQPSVDDKDGRSNDIVVPYASLQVTSQVGDVWLLQGDAKVYPSEASITQLNLTEARAVWLGQRLLQWPGATGAPVYKLYHSSKAAIQVAKGQPVSGAEGALTLSAAGAVPPGLAERFKYVAPGAVLQVAEADAAALDSHLTGQLVLVAETADGLAIDATETQLAGALDERYASAAAVRDFGATPAGGATSFKLWAPTATKVRACLYDSGTGQATQVLDLARDGATGVWAATQAADLSGKYFTYLVDVYARGTGVVRNRVTDPYSVSLTTDSRRSYIADLSSAALKPAGWDADTAPTVASPEDMSIYELHVRDFSRDDPTVPEARRGKYLAFAETASNGMKHLKALAAAGLTDVHLLPVYDFGSVPEAGCATPSIVDGASDSPTARDAIKPVADSDCFNWGYDPYHYTAPEGSFASDPADGARRVIEFREMVAALHRAGLRVGMDVVYNHTFQHGQSEKSVLDRIVPGYYHRLSAEGKVEMSTCCSNTATENAMMARLMIDSVKTWATQYRIDSFRFDLMGHQPRSVMEALKAEVDAAAGRSIFLIGEGWNFGEVANGARFVQASQLSLNGSGIGTFSDRARDRIRGGGCCDDGADFKRQGYVTGLFHDPNETANGHTLDQLLEHADIIRLGLAGSLRSYSFETADGTVKTGEELRYGGDPAGYASQPREVVNYYENHDNRTFWDGLAAKMPKAASLDDRLRAQTLAAAINNFSQGIAYFHAGADVLRSKSMDNNSYNSGDWFNRLDWSYATNHFGVGLPVSGNEDLAREVLAPANLPNMKPGRPEIEAASGMFRDLLKIRSSTPLFRLRSADEVKARLSMRNTGPAQVPTVLAGHLDGQGLPGANFREVLYFINVDKTARTLTLPQDKDKAWVLHPVHLSGTDRRPANEAGYVASTGSFTVPARTALVYVVNN
ncbi:alpha-1,6-glucosidase domain-containing protein [Rhizobacter sp. LjRoot28]|jgi:pullulanase/glycogen debranching enzyme|uniref:alpha-1,6-glucosidase domain-containing protein n=1 Tax=Rhizobacter sp. LjRoot28 TaxID=3342309 RepID=UPI003ED0F8EF